MQSAPFFFGNGVVVSGATAVNITSLLIGAGFTPTGSCVGLTITFDKDTYWGNSSSVTDSTGALVSAGQSIVDSATGSYSNVVPISQMYVYRAAALNTNCVIYARFIP